MEQELLAVRAVELEVILQELKEMVDQEIHRQLVHLKEKMVEVELIVELQQVAVVEVLQQQEQLPQEVVDLVKVETVVQVQQQVFRDHRLRMQVVEEVDLHIPQHQVQKFQVQL